MGSVQWVQSKWVHGIGSEPTNTLVTISGHQ